MLPGLPRAGTIRGLNTISPGLWAIKQRHADFKSSQAAKARARLEEEIRRRTADLHAEGKRPSMKLVQSRMSGAYLGYVQFWEILCDKKRRLAID